MGHSCPRILSVTLLLGSLFAGTHHTWTSGGEPLSDEALVLQAADAIRTCLMTRDTEGLKRLYHPEYEGTGIRGEPENLDAILSSYGPDGVQLHTFDTRDVTVDVWGEVGIVRGRGTIAGVYREQGFQHTVRYMDVFRKMPMGWQCIRSQMTEIAVPEPTGGGGRPVQEGRVSGVTGQGLR